MERLTERNRYKAAYYPYCFKEYTCDGKGASKKCDSCEFTTMVCERLAAYEDTGLTPEQILAMDGEYTKLAKELGEYKRLEEQRRLIKLPCKVGDIVYSLEFGRIKEYVATGFKVLDGGVFVCHKHLFVGVFGVSVFTTKEEAEKALAEMGE